MLMRYIYIYIYIYIQGVVSLKVQRNILDRNRSVSLDPLKRVNNDEIKR